MALVEQLAGFVTRARYDEISEGARRQLRVRVLDTLGCALASLDAEPIRMVRSQVEDFGTGGRCTLVGGGSAAPDRAALYNGALVRYPDFNDSFLAKGETCHPSDNLGAVLAAVEYAGGSGSDLLAALAVAYQVQCRLSEVAPVRAKGFDHTTQGSYAVAAGVSAALHLSALQTANAIAIAGTAFNSLRVTRTGALSHWKGLAYPNTAFGATHAAFLAMRGITGPTEVFEGNKGFMDAIAGRFTIDWGREDLEIVLRTILKRYNAEIHSQSAIEGLLELRAEHAIVPDRVERVDLETFDVAYNIIGGGEEGEKWTVRTKEEADHSLPYLLAVALLDGEVMPGQYRPERIGRGDVQELLRKVHVRPASDLSDRFPDEMPCRLRVTLSGGELLERQKRDHEGFHTRPMSWEMAVRKFERLSKGAASSALRGEIVDAVAHLDSLPISRLTALLARAGRAEGRMHRN